MNWEAIAAAAELIGAIAVILTLVYLALQIRQNTAALRSTATHGAHEQAAEVYRTLATDSELAAIYLTGIANPDELTESEMAKFISFMMYASFNYQNWFLQTKEQLMDDALVASWSQVISMVSNTPGFQYFWEQRGFVYSPEYRQFVDTLMAENRTAKYQPLAVSKRRSSK